MIRKEARSKINPMCVKSALCPALEVLALGSYQTNDARRSSQASSLVTLWAAPPDRDDARQSQLASTIHLFSLCVHHQGEPGPRSWTEDEIAYMSRGRR